MINRLKVMNYVGETLILNLYKPEETGFAVTKMEGIGPVNGTIASTEISTGDGSIFNTSRMGQRDMALSLRFISTEAETIEEVRNKSYRFFPVKTQIKVELESETKTVTGTGYVESNEVRIFDKEVGTKITVVFTDPYWYDIMDNTTVFAGMEAAFEFPFSNESLTQPLLVMGYIHEKFESLIVYEGEGEIGITIKMHCIGEVRNITIYNVKTREQMKLDTDKILALTGSGLKQGDDVVITTMKGNKSCTLIRGGDRINILNCLDRNTDWFMLRKGGNVFSYTAEYGDANLMFEILNRTKYEGV